MGVRERAERASTELHRSGALCVTSRLAHTSINPNRDHHADTELQPSMTGLAWKSTKLLGPLVAQADLPQ
jgi:hypothetical protein